MVRAGLTPKFKDVDVLCAMLDYHCLPAAGNLFTGRKDETDSNVTVFDPPVPDFAVMKIEVTSGLFTLFIFSNYLILIFYSLCVLIVYTLCLWGHFFPLLRHNYLVALLVSVWVVKRYILLIIISDSLSCFPGPCW